MAARQSTHPWLLGLLIPLKLKNPNLYQRFVEGKCFGSEVINYLDDVVSLQPIDNNSARTLDQCEAYLYRAESRFANYEPNMTTALLQLRMFKNGETLTHPEYLSKRTQTSDSQRSDLLIRIIESEPMWIPPDNAVSDLGKLIDIHQEIVRR